LVVLLLRPGQFKNLFLELLKGGNMAQEIKAQKPLNRAFGGQMVADHFKVANRVPHADGGGNRGYRQEFQTAGRNDWNPFIRLIETATNIENYFRGDHAARCSGIQNHGDHTHSGRANQLKRDNNKRTGAGHESKGRRIAHRQLVLRKGDQNIPGSTAHGLVGFVPMGAVEKKTSLARYGSRFIHFRNLDQEPFSAEALADFLDGFALFHDVFQCSTVDGRFTRLVRQAGEWRPC